MCQLFSVLIASILLFLQFYQTLACVDVLFVVDTTTLELSRNRAIQIAKDLPDDLKIRRWVVLSRNDRYVPRVVRNNYELVTVLSSVTGSYDRFLEVASAEIARRTETFQPFVILLFSETPVNETMSMIWRTISKAPALHIFRIGSTKKREILSEHEKTDFEQLLSCGRNRTFSAETFKLSSKFNGNEIRRKPVSNLSTTTPRTLTSTRDLQVRRLTFYDPNRTLLEEKPKNQEKKFTYTRTFKKFSSPAIFTTTPTTRLTKKSMSSVSRYSQKSKSTTKSWVPRVTTRKPVETIWKRFVTKSTSKSTTSRPRYFSKDYKKYAGVTKPTSSTTRKSVSRKARFPNRSSSSTRRYNQKMITSKPATTARTTTRTKFQTTTRPVTSRTSTMKRLSQSTTGRINTSTRKPSTTVKYYPYSKYNSVSGSTTTRKPLTTRIPNIRTSQTTRRTTKPWYYVPNYQRTQKKLTSVTQRGHTNRAQTYFTTTPSTVKTRKSPFAESLVTRRNTFLSSSTFSTTPQPLFQTLPEPPKKEEKMPKEFHVRSRSVQFAITEKPETTTTTRVTRATTTTQKTTTVPKVPYGCIVDVYFLVDLSQGTGDKSQQYLDIAASTINTMPIAQHAVRAGLISFSGPGRSQVHVYLDKHGDKEALIEEMFLMERHGGTTRTADAIRFAVKTFDDRGHPVRKHAKKVLVVFTDGFSQDDPKEAARIARSRGIQLIAVGVKDKLAPPDEQQLAIIGGNSQNYFVSPTGRLLREKILSNQCRI